MDSESAGVFGHLTFVVAAAKISIRELGMRIGLLLGCVLLATAAVAFALFFGTVVHPSLANYRQAFAISLIFAFVIRLALIAKINEIANAWR